MQGDAPGTLSLPLRSIKYKENCAEQVAQSIQNNPLFSFLPNDEMNSTNCPTRYITIPRTPCFWIGVFCAFMKRSEMLDRSNAKLLRDRIDIHHQCVTRSIHRCIPLKLLALLPVSLSHITRPSEAHSLLCGMAVGSQPAFCGSRNMTKNDEYERDIDHMCVCICGERWGDQMTRTKTCARTHTQMHVLETFLSYIRYHQVIYISIHHVFIVVTLYCILQHSA